MNIYHLVLEKQISLKIFMQADSCCFSLLFYQNLVARVFLVTEQLPIVTCLIRDKKLTQMRLEFAHLLTIKFKFVCFDVTSRVDV